VVYPFAVYFSAGIVWEYALSSLIFATGFFWAQGLDRQRSLWSWVGYGLLCGLAALVNPSAIPVLLLLLGMAARRVCLRSEPWTAKALVGLLALAIVVLPWTVRNQRVMHRLIPVRDGFWLEAWAGNAGDSSASNPAWAHPASNPAEMRQYLAMGETAYMASKKALAVEFIRTHPGWFAVASVRRVVRFWTGFWSFRISYLKLQPLDLPNVFFCTALTWRMLLGAVRWARSGMGNLAPYAVALLVFPLPYYVAHASMDYRQPIETVVLTLVVASFAVRKESQGRLNR
jgi:hypothetical protein